MAFVGLGRVKYNAALLVANILFGANFSFYVSLTQHFLSFKQIFMLQTLTAAMFFIPFAIFSPRSYRITVEDFGSIFIVALLVIYGWLYLSLWGASSTNPVDAATIATLGPVFTLFTARVVGSQPMGWARTAGAVVALIGATILLADQGHDLVSTSNEGFGNALVLCSVVAIAVNTVLIKPQLERYGEPTVMGWYYIIGFAMVAPFFWSEIAGLNLLLLPLGALLELLYILLLGTVLPMWLLYIGAANLSSVHTAVYRYVQPVVAVVISLVRGQNNIDRANVIGAAFIFIGIIFVVFGRSARKESATRE